MRRLLLGVGLVIFGLSFLTLGFLAFVGGGGQISSGPLAVMLIGSMSLIVGIRFLGLGVMWLVRGSD